VKKDEGRIPHPESQIPALSRLRETWHALGEDDPLWAILSRPDKRGQRWDADEFFAAGEAEIAAVDARCAALGLARERRCALDFGCGVGRLTRALAGRFAEVVGVDISPSMIAQARALNAHIPNVRFVENATSRLAFLGDASIDLVYSVITLHHIPADLQRAYIGEFLRVLAPGGAAVFQIASSYARDWRGFGYRLLPNRVLAPLRRRLHESRTAAEMHILEESAVAALAAAAGKRIVQAVATDSAGQGFRGVLFVVAG